MSLKQISFTQEIPQKRTKWTLQTKCQDVQDETIPKNGRRDTSGELTGSGEGKSPIYGTT